MPRHSAVYTIILKKCTRAAASLHFITHLYTEGEENYNLSLGSNDRQCQCSLLIFIIKCIFPPSTRLVSLWKATADLRLGFTVLNVSYVNKVNGNTQ